MSMRYIKGLWMDPSGFIADLNEPMLIGEVIDNKFEDESRFDWTVNADGILVSDHCVMTFAPDAGELARVGLA